jgi:hypothetical protein
MPRSILKKVRQAIATDHEWEALKTLNDQKPTAPDVEQLEALVQNTLGRVSSLTEIKRKSILLQLVLRLYGNRTYNRGGVTAYPTRPGCYIVQLLCTCNKKTCCKKEEGCTAPPSSHEYNQSTVETERTNEGRLASKDSSSEHTRTVCSFQVTFLFEYNESKNEFSCKINQKATRLYHRGHDNAQEWDSDLKALRKNITIEKTYLAASTLSAAKATRFATGEQTDQKLSFTLKQRIHRDLGETYTVENEDATIEEFFKKNGFKYEMNDRFFAWCSPAMQANVDTYLDPFHFDGTHSIPVLGRRKQDELPQGNLYQFLSPNREGGIMVLAQALTFGESSDVATPILQFVKGLFEGNEPKLIFTDDAKGFRRAIRKVFRRSYHRGCGFHIFQRWRPRLRHFKDQAKISRAKTLLWKSITCIDSKTNDHHWKALYCLCKENLSKEHWSFLDYYDRNRTYWSFKGIPRQVFIGNSFANSIAESANNMVKRQGICKARSTLRVIYISLLQLSTAVSLTRKY